MNVKRVNISKSDNNNSKIVQFHRQSDYRPIAFCCGRPQHINGITKIVGYIGVNNKEWWHTQRARHQEN